MTAAARQAAARLLSRAEIGARLRAGGAVPRGDTVTATRLAGSAAKATPLPPERYAAAGMTNMLRVPSEARVPAAVLVPLIERAEGYTILFTKRTADLKAHAGQISFPGGRLEEHDADAAAGALRECREEIGLAPERVEVLGQLDPYITITGFVVTPVVGVIRPPVELHPDPKEVAEVFEVPLAFLLDAANHEIHSRTTDGAVRAYYALSYGDRYIWGATAGMLLNLYDVLSGEPRPDL